MTSPANGTKTRRMLVGALIALVVVVAGLIFLNQGGSKTTPVAADPNARVTLTELTVGGSAIVVTPEQMTCAIERYNTDSGDSISGLDKISSNLIIVRRSDLDACR